MATQYERQQLHGAIGSIELKLNDTLDMLDRGPVKDAMRLVVPMMQDQCVVLHMLVETLTDGDGPVPFTISNDDLTAALKEYGQTPEGQAWLRGLDLPERLPQTFGDSTPTRGTGECPKCHTWRPDSTPCPEHAEEATDGDHP